MGHFNLARLSHGLLGFKSMSLDLVTMYVVVMHAYKPQIPLGNVGTISVFH